MRAKKSLGQHFLTSRSIINHIVQSADIQKKDTVLEVGPGKGILTVALLEKAKMVIAIEKDESLVIFLKEKFESEIKNKKLILVHGDILKYDFSKFKTLNSKFKVVANIPYYITGEFLRKILSSKVQPSLMALLVQKEVAKRIVTSGGKESILSLSIKAYGEPNYIKTVPARYFKPKPKVDSAILSVENISKDFFRDYSEELFFTLIKAGFLHKRKMLIKNIVHLYRKNDIAAIFSKCDIPITCRAEDIPLNKWSCLCTKRAND